jgi:hypothetical protein
MALNLLKIQEKGFKKIFFMVGNPGTKYPFLGPKIFSICQLVSTIQKIQKKTYVVPCNKCGFFWYLRNFNDFIVIKPFEALKAI